MLTFLGLVLTFFGPFLFILIAEVYVFELSLLSVFISWFSISIVGLCLAVIGELLGDNTYSDWTRKHYE
jgi:hypothetical protein